MALEISYSHTPVPHSHRQRELQHQAQDIASNRERRTRTRRRHRSQQYELQEPTRLRSGSVAVRHIERFASNDSSVSCLRIAGPEQWNVDELPMGTREIVFEQGFKVKNSHILGIVTASSMFRTRLLKITCADGSSLTDAALVQLASSCRALETVALTSAVKLTDTAVVAFLHKCRKLHTLSITGTSTTLGNIKGTFLKGLFGLPEQIQNVNFTNQQIDLAGLTGAFANRSMSLSIDVGYSVDNTAYADDESSLIDQAGAIEDGGHDWELPAFDNFYSDFRETVLNSMFGDIGHEAFLDEAYDAWEQYQAELPDSEAQAGDGEDIQALLT